MDDQMYGNSIVKCLPIFNIRGRINFEQVKFYKNGREICMYDSDKYQCGISSQKYCSPKQVRTAY